MDPRIRHKALASAARVALGCCLGAAGCGGKAHSALEPEGTGPSEAAESEPTPTATAEPMPTATATAEPMPTATTTAEPMPTATATAEPMPTATATAEPPEPEFACTGTPARVEDLKAQSPAVQCCKDFVGAAVGEAPFAEELFEDASIRNCCRELALNAQFVDEPSHRFCCSGKALSEEDYRRSYCSPWGPAVPPALGVA